MITGEELVKIMPFAKKRVGAFVAPINGAMLEFEINNPAREAAFLAQIAHESGELRYMEELASGEAYEGRRELGNTEPGDGVLYKGRGPIQLTGRANYATCGDALGIDLVSNPARASDPDVACRIAGWFWKTRGLNELADKGNFLLITKRINGGTNGYASRMEYWQRAQQVLGHE